MHHRSRRRALLERVSPLVSRCAPIFAACALVSLAARAADAPANAPAPPASGERAEGSALVVVLDPGHGGPFPHDGAHGAKGLVEKTIALQVAKRLQAALEAAGATVLLTREDDDADVSLADRARFANEANADLFVSIHLNSMATGSARKVTRGIETYFLSPDPTDAEARMLAELENGGPAAVPLPKSNDAVTGLLADLALGQARNDSAVLAETLHRALVHETGAPSRGVRQAPFLVLSGTKMPSTLVEIGFISHPAEGKLLAKDAYQDKIAAALAEGVRDFAAHVLMRRLLPPNDDARAALLARRTEEAQARAQRKASSSGHQASPAAATASAAANAPAATATASAAPPAAPAASAAIGPAGEASKPTAAASDGAASPDAPVSSAADPAESPAASPAAPPLAPALETPQSPSPAPVAPPAREPDAAAAAGASPAPSPPAAPAPAEQRAPPAAPVEAAPPAPASVSPGHGP